jgi:hypothetical protein
MDILRKYPTLSHNPSEEGKYRPPTAHRFYPIANTCQFLAVLEDVRQMYTRLGVLLCTFGYISKLKLSDNGSRQLEGCFQNMAQARNELFALLAQSNTLRLATNEWRGRLFEAERQHELLEPARARTSTEILGSNNNPSLDEFLEKVSRPCLKISLDY